MKIKPWPIIILAVLHILAPIGNFVFNAFRLNHSFAQQWNYWFEIYPKPLLAVSLLTPIIAGIAIYICRKWSYYLYLVCLSIIFFVNLYAFSTSFNVQTLLALILVTAIDLVAVAYFVLPSVKKIYLDPRMRWWEAMPRYHFDEKGTINNIEATFVNISQGGLLARSSSRFTDNSHVEVRWANSPTLKAHIVYQGIIHGHESIGVKFEHTPESEKYIKQLIRQLEQNGKILKERLPGPEDSFGAWLKKLLTRGEGLIPKTK
ncbi:MAG: PilZ domain-containing protein [Bdellovibrionia bacterium]